MKPIYTIIHKCFLLLIVGIAWAGTVEAACSANFTWNQSSPNTIAFTSTSTGTSAYTQYFWTYGDGSPQGSGASNSHVFNLPGNYAVTLTIHDSISGPCNSTVTNTVTVTGTVICALTASVGSHPPTCNTCSDGAASVMGVSGGVAPFFYSWNAGGSPTSMLDSGVASGNYTVTITDANGCHLTLTDSVPANLSACIASFTHTQTAANTIQYTSTSTGTSSNTTYSWNFGDGNSGSGSPSSHFYNLPGHYTVTLFISDSIAGHCSSTHTDTASVTGSVVCAITGSIYQVNASCTTCADGNASVNISSGGTAPYTYSWSGGTAPTSTSATGLAPGTYSVLLTDANNCHFSQSFTITSRDTNCHAAFTKVQSAANTIQFTSTSLHVSSNTTYNWQYGDGTASGYSFTANQSHVYSAPGLYTVCLLIQDTMNGAGQSCASHLCDTVHVSGSVIHTCNASFYLRADSLNVGDYFAINSSSGTGPIHCNWAWGDGTSDTTTNPVHTYPTAGLYTICLTITDANGCSSNFCDTLTAARLPYWIASHHTTIKVINRMALTGIKEADALDTWKLFPNPSAGDATITYSLHSAALIKVEVYDVSGRMSYRSKSIGLQDSGSHSLNLDLSSLQAGTYFIRIYANDRAETKLLNLIR